jgi:hypothetical protein
MFLPEHVKLLRGYDQEHKKKQRAVLDEQQMELIQETIYQGMEEGRSFCFTYFHNYDYHLLIGKVHYVNLFNKELHIQDAQEEICRLKLMDLIDVRIH